MHRSVWLVGLVFAAGCGGGKGSPSSDGGTGNHPPSASFSVAASVALLTPLVLDASASRDPDGDALGYHWDFGDGERGGGVTLAHQFGAAGSFTVTLTVSDSHGSSATQQALVTVSAPTLGASVPVIAHVVDLGGVPLAGVSASAPGVTGSPSDSNGQLTLSVPSGRAYSVALSLAGYASQFHVVDLTNPPTTAVHFDVTMRTRDAAAPLDAGKGGSLSGRDGAKITLPSGALVDSNGASVTGSVDIAMTALDPTTTAGRHAFPGRYIGVTPDAASGPLLSYGTTEFALSQSGQRLQLAPGKVATIETPIYATHNADGSTVKAGDHFPLWSLDESSGSWVQEGIGTVVASASSPSGLSLQGDVAHFSWWNCDYLSPHFIGTITPQCDPNDFLCQELDDSFDTTINAQNEDSDPGQPGIDATEDDDEGQPIQLTIPTTLGLQLGVTAFGGALTGTQPIKSAGSQPQSLTILMRSPSGTSKSTLSDASVTLPYSVTATFSGIYTVRRYHVTVNIGDALAASYQPQSGAGVLSILDSTDTALVKQDFDGKTASVSVTATGTDYVVQLVAVTEGQGTVDINVGSSTSETVTTPFDRADSYSVGDRHIYRFTVEKGALYEARWSATPSVSGTIVAKDSAGTTLGSGLLSFGSAIDFTAGLAGVYEVDVQALAPASVELKITETAGPPSSTEIPITLPFVPTSTSTLTVAANTSKKFVFTGAPGLVALAQLNDMSSPFGSAGIRAYPRNQTPAEAYVVEQDSPAPVGQWLALAADQPSDYIVELFNDAPIQRVFSNFSINIAGPVIAVTPSADVVAATMPSAAATPAFTYSANAGDVFNVNVTPTNCAGSDARETGTGGYAAGGLNDYELPSGGSNELALWTGTQAVVFTEPSAKLSPCNLTIGVTKFVPSTLGKMLDYAVTPGANTLGQQVGSYAAAPSSGYVSTKVLVNTSSGNCSVLVRGKGSADGAPSSIGLCTNSGLDGCKSAAVLETATGSNVTVEVISGHADSCSGSVYVWPVASPSPMALLPTQAKPITTTVAIGQRAYYAFVGDGVARTLQSPSVLVSGTLAASTININVYADNGKPYAFWGGTALASESNSVSGASTSSFTVASGTLYYVEIYGHTDGGQGNTSTDVTWYLK